MQDAKVLARINLDALLSNLEIMASDDAETSSAAKSWNGSITFAEYPGNLCICGTRHPAYDKIIVVGKSPCFLEHIHALVDPADFLEESYIPGIR